MNLTASVSTAAEGYSSSRLSCDRTSHYKWQWIQNLLNDRRTSAALCKITTKVVDSTTCSTLPLTLPEKGNAASERTVVSLLVSPAQPRREPA